METRYENRYAGLTAEIEELDTGEFPLKFRLKVSNAEGDVEHESHHRSKDAARRALSRYWNGWESVENERPQAKSLRDRCIDAGALFYERHGGKVLERDWASPHGGCDLVVLDGETLVFAQVRYRTEGDEPESGPMDINAEREHMERIAVDYVSARVFGETVVRFDVLDMIAMPHGRVFVGHHMGAFSAGA